MKTKRFKTAVRQSIGKCIFEDWKSIGRQRLRIYFSHQPKNAERT